MLAGERSGAIPVKIGSGGIERGGEPYFVKGAGGSGCMEQLAARGGNSLRTWDTRNLGVILDQAQRLGLTVSAGIWLEPECSWFSYKNPEHCARQVKRVREAVTLHRDHPALLAWGLGNEIEGDGTNDAIWRQIDRLAVLVREIDPAHPTFTAVAGITETKAKGLNAHAPHLDFLGINTYGAIFGLRRNLVKMGWERPWMLTEWGPRGFWEMPKGAGGAPLEQTSSEKAEMVSKAYEEVIRRGGACLGSYVFVWGWKFEATATWFGVFTHQEEATAVADSLQEAWGGGQPSNRAPRITKVEGVPRAPMAAGERFEARVSASDPDGDGLKWVWKVLPEAKKHDAGSRPPMPKELEGAVLPEAGERVVAVTPRVPGVYRLHVWVSDGKGNAATANAPFEVRSDSEVGSSR